MKQRLVEFVRPYYNRALLEMSADPRTVRVAGCTAQYRVTSLSELWQVRDIMAEREFLEDVLAHTEPGDVVYDVGANIGLFTCLLAQAGGEVHAFEPDAVNRERLRENLALNGLEESVSVHRVGLSDENRSMRLAVESADGPIRPQAHVEPAAAQRAADGSGTVVQVRRGDRLGVRPPDVVKVDVEGHEVAVLRGLSGVLDEVRHVFVEVHRGLGVSEDEVRTACREAGLSPSVVVRRESDGGLFLRADSRARSSVGA